jgi:hypothetical protein
MKYAAEMGSGGKLYIPSFVKIDSAIQKLMAGINRQTDRQTHTHTHKDSMVIA